MKTAEPISVGDVRISTATVEIQVIRIGSKQMTLAVFRQLTRKDIFDRSGNLLAPPWGWVNYDHSSHGRAFIFSHEGALYKCNVDLELPRKLSVNSDVRHSVKEGYWDRASGKYVPEQHLETHTGKWFLGYSDETYYSNMTPLRLGLFSSELNARQHLDNRLESIRVLEGAPQLFIAV